jgi:lysine 2,3-aminomutase
MVEEWKQILEQSITTPEQVHRKFKVDMESLKAVVSKYPMKISKYYFDLIEKPGDPIWRQCVPSPLELQDHYGFKDPLNEEGQSLTPGLIHRYPDRVLMCVSNKCATYCRFCTRKRRVGDPVINYSRDDLLKQVQYIKKTPTVRDVLLSGGDPLILSNEEIEPILKKVRTIPHVEILRIGSRVPCTFPQRITSKLCTILSKYHPLYVNIHFNHPREVTEESERACGLLADAGIPLGSQTVLLRGVNDNPEVMKSLIQKLLKIRVKPYYLFQMDLVRGTYHFRTRVETGIRIMESLIGYTSGLAVPRYIVDSPSGRGKIPIQPNYIQSFKENKIILRNFEGKTVIFPQIPLSDDSAKNENPSRIRETRWASK